jgi:lipoprotein NlpD
MMDHRLARISAVITALVLAGCANTSGTGSKAPVEDRNAASPKPAVVATPTAPVAAADVPARLPPGSENAGKPGYYTVKPGDTLTRIALDQGQPWRDIARWNGIENANVIEVGQVLRVAPPGVETAAVKPVLPPKPVAPGVAGAPGAPATAGAPGTTPAPPGAATTTPVAPPVAPQRDGDEDVNWAWPAAGSVATGFEEGRNKGLAIVGKPGDAVLAAADGRVVYAGSGLRGYGNLIIIKHNATYLTAYAHNQALFVKEDQAVRRGQRIADMGSSDAERVQLHFEIRRLGKPIDPAKLLPPR